MRHLASTAVALLPLVLTLACHDFGEDLETCRASGRCLPGACATALPFDLGSSSPVGFDGRSRDFNDDGRLDLALVDSSGCAGVALGNGDGTFRPPSCLASGVGSLPASGDFNRDGKVDLALASSGAVNLLLASGGGTFHAPIGFPTGVDSPHALVAGDVNGDGKLDLAITFNPVRPGALDRTATSVLLGNGDGTFQAAIAQSFTGAVASWNEEIAGTLDADARLDLLVAGAELWLLRGVADGTFQPIRYASEAFQAVGAGDVNGDGDTDLVVAAHRNDSTAIRLFFGSWSGFSEPVRDAASYASRSTPCSILVGDFSADGRPDLVVGHDGFDLLRLLWSNGNGTFQEEPYPGNVTACSYLDGDFNGDGKTDLVIPGVAVLLQTRCAP